MSSYDAMSLIQMLSSRHVAALTKTQRFIKGYLITPIDSHPHSVPLIHTPTPSSSMLYDLRCCGFDRVMANSRVFFSDLKFDKCSSVVEARLLRNVKRGGELVWVDMLMVDVNVTHIYIYDVYFKLRYRVEMAIADDTAEGTFVWFDGVMTKLHNLRASEAVQMLAEDGVNPDDSRIPPFIADMEGKSYTFQVRVTAYNFTSNHKTFTITLYMKQRFRKKQQCKLIFSIVDELGRVRDDDVDDNVSIMCNTEVTRMMMTTCLMASQLLLGLHLEGPLVMDQMGLYGTARKNPDVSSSKVVKKARVA
ncbi:hypothetical protein HID58_080424 [Brassica napus]|uniref:Uncharacterized protein n=1 Tax=Brassica napus TaxID=3708 RepID=A0ABQ7Y4V1_BRANA|nr:hypothetical protein HID58_080424 [Brassica napus]